ncbi:unnamed protein product [Clonostachys rhizophaga]|uniref:HD domain-containing protein n=1 Tax=Clonostachys rhizophaga TaxID=160324 RepID=A0A9N9YL79_9HYPO|nr:unnamed protein product [Clonostachys rhizophaga]
MSYLTVPLPFREARYMAEHIREVTLRRHQVPPPELLQVHTDLMVRLCYLHPDIEDRDVNKLVMMCMIHDLNQVVAIDETIPQGTCPNQRQWEERETIFYLETRLKPSNPALAQALFNLWKEYGANETFLAKLFREIRDLVRFHRAFMHEKRAQRIYAYHYIERLRLCIGNEWLQVIADSILDSWIVVKEIQNAGPIYFVFGGPGSGKTFVCERLSATHGLEHISVAALIEEEANDPSSARGITINTNRSRGRPIPVDLSISLLKDRLRQADGSGILIDGFPASMDELREFEKEV